MFCMGLEANIGSLLTPQSQTQLLLPCFDGVTPSDFIRCHISSGLRRLTPPTLPQDFRAAVGGAVGEDGQPILKEEKLTEILNLLPEVYLLHCHLLDELENRMLQW